MVAKGAPAIGIAVTLKLEVSFKFDIFLKSKLFITLFKNWWRKKT